MDKETIKAVATKFVEALNMDGYDIGFAGIPPVFPEYERPYNLQMYAKKLTIATRRSTRSRQNWRCGERDPEFGVWRLGGVVVRQASRLSSGAHHWQTNLRCSALRVTLTPQQLELIEQMIPACLRGLHPAQTILLKHHHFIRVGRILRIRHSRRLRRLWLH